MDIDEFHEFEPIIWRFEDAWRSSVEPDPAEFLVGLSHQHQADLLVEISLIDLEHRVRRNPNANADKYLQKYPEIYQVDSVRNDLIRCELKLRKKLGQFPNEAEFQSRFPDHADVQAIRSSIESELSTSRGIGEFIAEGSQVGCYKIECRIGSGAFAEVYRAHDTKLNRPVALKFLKPWTREAEHLRGRMLREAQAVATLQHAHVVPIYETGSVDGHDYIASRFIDGPTLSGWIQQRPADFQEAVRIVAQLAIALDAAHSNGIVHRDIKPDNVMMDDDSPMLLDFGLAHFANASVDLTQEGDIVGTPAYMSPEQASGTKEVGPASDIYSLGVILYQMTTGRLPFEGAAPALMHQTIHEDPLAPQKLNSNIPLDLQTICLKALSKSSTDRYLSAAAFADDLWRFFRREPILARPIGTAERLSRMIRKYPIASTLAALLVLFFGVGLGGAYQYRDVLIQRNRATEAETQTRQLLAKDAAVSGQLAQRQGQTQAAVLRYLEAIDSGHQDVVDLHIRIAECELINGRYKKADQHLEIANQLGVDVSDRPRVEFIRLQLVLGSSEFDSDVDPIQLMESIDSTTFSEPDRHYFSGLNAADSRTALQEFRTAVVLDSHHYLARRMSGVVAFTLAEFDLTLDICEASDQVFPNDPNFQLLRLLAESARGNQMAVENAVDGNDDATAVEDQRQALAEFVRHIGSDFDSGDIRVFKEDRAGDSELQLSQLVELFDRFRSDHLPFLQQHHWYLPPRIERAMWQFYEAASMQSKRDRSKSVFDSVMNSFSSADAKFIQAGARILAAHPESSLSIAIASDTLDRSENSVEDVTRTQGFYEQAIHSHGFIRGTKKHAMIGVYLTALALSRAKDVNVEANNQRAFQIHQAIDPNTISDLNLLRVFSLTPLQETVFWDLAGRFIPRWVEVSRQENDQEMILDSLWTLAVYYQKKESWFQTLKTADEILERFPDTEFTPPVDPIGIRINAVTRLSNLVSDNKPGTNWNHVTEYSIFKQDWDRAQGAILQLKLVSAGAPEQLRRVEFYSSLLKAVRSDDNTAVITAFDRLPSTDHVRSEWLNEVFNAAKSKRGQSQLEKKP